MIRRGVESKEEAKCFGNLAGDRGFGRSIGMRVMKKAWAAVV
jgi:hypothetical protein